MQELWQLFDEQGKPLQGMGASKNEVFSKGLLHGASHVWIWRDNNGLTEVLLQKRAPNKRTWPNRFDISAAGHINLGENPVTAAMRETKEEIGIDIHESDLREISLERAHLTAENGAIENEFQWLYLLEMPTKVKFLLQPEEVAQLAWKTLDDFSAEYTENSYVPHGKDYYSKVVSAIQSTH